MSARLKPIAWLLLTLAAALAGGPALARPAEPGPAASRLIAQAINRLNGKEVFVRFRPFD
ncbi:MAG: hypothetical protein C4525_14445 [Desulfarculus sp.]|nr:MAG: hypothetical protein C4525_14445 [Desulfarculus sp.]